ncbi:Hypothetical_protein [Hexamita inflata]|uniref:Hypothetical_protein n=1 Tax=Hexamita inflata TaxID=28002 RepID=A0ABP1LSI5_9EUKA
MRSSALAPCSSSNLKQITQRKLTFMKTQKTLKSISSTYFPKKKICISSPNNFLKNDSVLQLYQNKNQSTSYDIQLQNYLNQYGKSEMLIQNTQLLTINTLIDNNKSDDVIQRQQQSTNYLQADDTQLELHNQLNNCFSKYAVEDQLS